MDAFHETYIKGSQFIGLTLIDEMFTKVIFFALLVVAISGRPRASLRMPIFPPFSPQIVGGEEAPVGGYPFIVSLRAKGVNFCAGSILNENWILTAGHCAQATSEKFITVRAGKHNISQDEDSEQAIQVVKSIVHEKYQGGVGPYDVAVLKLASPLKLNKRVQSIELAPPKSEPTGVAWLCGWGSVGAIFPDMPDNLQHVKLEYIDRELCDESVERLTGNSSVHETNVCTGPMYDQISACSGDSGGPLISRNGEKAILTGIVSWGIMPCGSAGAPSVYTKAETFRVTDQIYFDIMIDNHPVGRIVIGLFGDIAPKTVKNFITFATTGVAGKKYAGTKFHRVVKKFMIQGGDVENGDGTGSISIYGKYFDDETFEVKHSGSLFVSMANAGKNANGCQFFITTVATPWLDDHHTVFGKVVSGEAVVFKIEQTKTDSDDVPLVSVIIYDSGILPTEPFTVSDNPYDVWAWIKATCVPLGFSFSILAVFHYMMKQLDV